MGRKKVKNKNKVISISLPVEQVLFIEEHPEFNLSKFTQISLHDYINFHYNIFERN